MYVSTIQRLVVTSSYTRHTLCNTQSCYASPPTAHLIPKHMSKQSCVVRHTQQHLPHRFTPSHQTSTKAVQCNTCVHLIFCFTASARAISVLVTHIQKGQESKNLSYNFLSVKSSKCQKLSLYTLGGNQETVLDLMQRLKLQ